MWSNTTYERDRGTGRREECLSYSENDFSPTFWLASAPAGGGPPRRALPLAAMSADFPFSYPLLVALLLALAFLVQRNFLSFL